MKKYLKLFVIMGLINLFPGFNKDEESIFSSQNLKFITGQLENTLKKANDPYKIPRTIDVPLVYADYYFLEALYRDMIRE